MITFIFGRKQEEEEFVVDVGKDKLIELLTNVWCPCNDFGGLACWGTLVRRWVHLHSQIFPMGLRVWKGWSHDRIEKKSFKALWVLMELIVQS